MKKDIKSLKELQAIDLQVKKLDDEIQEGNASLDRRREAIEKRQQAISQLEEKIEIIASRKRELEAGIEDEAARVKDRQTKLMNVQTNREYQSLLKEIEDSKKSTREREDELVRLMERNEALQNDLVEQNNVLNSEQSLLAEATEELAKATAELSSQKAEIVKEREEKAQKVSAGGLKKYEMLREKRSGVAVVAVVNGVCRGCHMNIPPQLFNNLMKNEELLTCPTCHRMMFYEPAAEAK